jgi:hypothetical protein
LKYQLARDRMTRRPVKARVAGGVEEMACHGEESRALDRENGESEEGEEDERLAAAERRVRTWEYRREKEEPTGR